MGKISQVRIPDRVKADFYSELGQRILAPVKTAQKLGLYEWALRYRRFEGQPPSIPPILEDLYKDMAQEIVVLKAAQMFVSEWGINTVLWAADQKWADRGVCLYVFPKQEQMDDFSQGRVAKAITQSPYLSARVKQVSRWDNTNRTRLRNIAGSPIYFRGSDTVMQTRAIDADVVCLDEVDLFKEGAVERAKERLGSSLSPLVRAFSQPLYPGGPIDILWQRSDQRHYYIPCASCGTEQFLTWEDNIEFNLDYTDCRTVCRKCKKPIDRLAPGRWIAHEPTNLSHGYHVSKLYSPRVDLKILLQRYLTVDDPAVIQSFYNADLGLPYRPAGSPAIGDFAREYYPWGQPMQENYMGIDVGRKLHIAVIGKNPGETPRLIYCQAVDSFDDSKSLGLEQVWQMFQPRLTVIDARGDPRATKEWSSRHFGKVYRWEHKPSAVEPKFVDDEVHYHRTALLDRLYAVLKSRNLILHTHAEPEFYDHLEANVREIVKDKGGRLVPRYVPTKADHYAFALAFAIVAMGSLVSSSRLSVVSAGSASSPRGRLQIDWSGWGSTRWSKWR